jgi:hypothetical protein
MNEEVAAGWAKSLADPFLQAWPESLIESLSTDPERLVSAGQQLKDVLREGGVRGRLFRVPDLTTVRQQQRELRALVDRYVDGEDITTVVKALRAKLDRQPYRVFIGTPEETPGYPVKGGAKAFIRYQRWENPREVRFDDWLGFARLLADPLAERLKRCPECRKYFLADRRITKKFCSLECGWRNRRVKQVVKNPQAYLKKEKERVKGFRQRKKQQTT